MNKMNKMNTQSKHKSFPEAVSKELLKVIQDYYKNGIKTLELKKCETDFFEILDKLLFSIEYKIPYISYETPEDRLTIIHNIFIKAIYKFDLNHSSTIYSGLYRYFLNEIYSMNSHNNRFKNAQYKTYAFSSVIGEDSKSYVKFLNNDCESEL